MSITSPFERTARFVCFVALLFGITPTRAQTYRPMLMDSMMSNNYSHDLIGFNFTTTVVRDSAWNNYTYKLIRLEGIESTALQDSALWREDTLSRTVYRLFNGQEFVLYDFSLAPGDTLTVCDASFSGTQFYTLQLDSIGSTPPFQTTCSFADPRFFYFQGVCWLEGVGALHSYSGTFAEYDLLCHTDAAGVHDFENLSLQAPLGSCLGLSYGGIGEQSEPMLLRIVPNPVVNGTVLSWALPADPDWACSISDATGRAVLRAIIPAGTTSFPLDLSWFDPGIYPILLTDGSGAVSTALLVKQ